MKTNFVHKIFNPEPSFLTKDYSILFFRILVSSSMINTHGLKKLFNFQETVKHIPDPLGIGGELSTIIAIIASIIAPIFIIAGMGTRLAVVPILAVTLSGLFLVHNNDPWTIKDVPIMYSLCYLLIFFLGAGKYSIDHKFLKYFK